MVVIQCETQLFLIVISLRLYVGNNLIPQETEQGGSKHKQLCPELVFSVFVWKPVHFHTRSEVCSPPEMF